VVTCACQSITRSYLPGQVAEGARYPFKERKLSGGLRGFVYRRVEGGASSAGRFRECRVAESQGFK
jgi:hypothetical protein